MQNVNSHIYTQDPVKLELSATHLCVRINIIGVIEEGAVMNRQLIQTFNNLRLTNEEKVRAIQAMKETIEQ